MKKELGLIVIFVLMFGSVIMSYYSMVLAWIGIVILCTFVFYELIKDYKKMNSANYLKTDNS